MSHFILGVIFGVAVETTVVIGWLWLTGKPHERMEAAQDLIKKVSQRGYPRRGQRPDERRIILRPVNMDQPPSRVSQALFRQRPTRKLKEDDKD